MKFKEFIDEATPTGLSSKQMRNEYKRLTGKALPIGLSKKALRAALDRVQAMKEKRSKKDESMDESNKKEARKILNGLKAKLKKYPDMPEEIKASLNQLVSFYEKELKTYTHADVFPKDYSRK